MPSVILDETETTESFSNKLMLSKENITSVKDGNDIISYGITNSRDSRRVFQLMERYSVLKVVSKSNRYSHALITNFVFIIFPFDMYNLLR